MKTANKTITATRLIKDALKKAKHFSDYNIFTFINEATALKQASIIDARIAKGEKVGPLAGVPYAIKDNFLSPVGETTASTHILEGFTSPITSTAVKKLEDAGAIMIGRTNMDAFAHGSSTESSYFGPTLNAFDKTRVAGGSSGGSAVAVALDIVEFATGTDTGGSIRQPASFNGIYGFKPTYGAISRSGVIAMASSLDTVGFFSKSPTDLDILMSITAGPDPADATTLPAFYSTPKKSSISPTTIGIIKNFDNDVIHPKIRQALKNQCEKLKKQGHKIVELNMPTLKYALPAYYIIQPAEVASNLSRYDGIRYGFHSKKVANLKELYENTRGEGFTSENKRRVMIGNFVLSSRFFDDYFLQAAKVRTLIIKEYTHAFEQCDFILTPVTPQPAFRLKEKINDPIAMYLGDIMSVPANLAGLPALTIPTHETINQLPIGLQLSGPRRSDASLLKFAGEIA